MSLTAQLAGIIRNTTFDSLSVAGIHTAKRLIADGIAVAGSGAAVANDGDCRWMRAGDRG